MEANLKTGQFADRREHMRKEVQWPVTILTCKGPVEGEAKNFCANGLYIECGERLYLHEVFSIYIGIDEASVLVRGEVVWVRIDSDDEGFPFYCIGISFVG